MAHHQSQFTVSGQSYFMMPSREKQAVKQQTRKRAHQHRACSTHAVLLAPRTLHVLQHTHPKKRLHPGPSSDSLRCRSARCSLRSRTPARMASVLAATRDEPAPCGALVCQLAVE